MKQRWRHLFAGLASADNCGHIDGNVWHHLFVSDDINVNMHLT